MTPETLEILMKLMKSYNVDMLEIDGAKICMHPEVPVIPKSKMTIEKLDKIAGMPQPEELMYLSSTAPDPLAGLLPPRTVRKSNGS